MISIVIGWDISNIYRKEAQHPPVRKRPTESSSNSPHNAHSYCQEITSGSIVQRLTRCKSGKGGPNKRVTLFFQAKDAFLGG